MKLYRCLYSILSKCQFFCGVIWILTNSFMCRKRVQVDEQIWTFLKAKDKRAASHCTKTKHQVWSYSIYFYNVWRVGSCDVKKKNKKEKKSRETKQSHVAIFLLLCETADKIQWWWWWCTVSCPASVCLRDRKRIQSKLVSLMRHQGERHVPALKSNFFLCDVCDFIKLAYFTQCLQRCTLW